MTISGQCLCGQASYTATNEPIATAVCHCTNCQRQSGSAFSIVVIVATAELAISGTLKTFLDVGYSGAEVQRCFCPECGSPVISRLTDAPMMTVIKAGTLDDTSAFVPQFHVWCDSAQPWVKIDPATPQFAHNPPETSESRTADASAMPFDLEHGSPTSLS